MEREIEFLKEVQKEAGLHLTADHNWYSTAIKLADKGLVKITKFEEVKDILVVLTDLGRKLLRSH